MPKPVARVKNQVISLTDAATIETDASKGDYFAVSIAGNRTLNIPTNPTIGQRVLWEVLATSAGPYTITLATGTNGFKFGTDITSIPTIAANTTTFIGAVYRGISQRWHVIAVSSGH